MTENLICVVIPFTYVNLLLNGLCLAAASSWHRGYKQLLTVHPEQLASSVLIAVHWLLCDLVSCGTNRQGFYKVFWCPWQCFPTT